MIVFPFGTKINGLFLFHALSQQHTAVCVQNMDFTHQWLPLRFIHPCRSKSHTKLIYFKCEWIFHGIIGILEINTFYSRVASDECKFCDAIIVVSTTSTTTT